MTGVVVLSLALGIGANSAIFGLADQILIGIIGVLADARYENVRGKIPRQTFISLGGAPPARIDPVRALRHD